MDGARQVGEDGIIRAHPQKEAVFETGHLEIEFVVEARVGEGMYF